MFIESFILRRYKRIFKNSFLKSLSAAVDEDVDTKNSLYVTIVIKKFKKGKK